MLTARLDGTGERVKERMSQHASIEDWLELGEDARPARKGEKRVGKTISNKKADQLTKRVLIHYHNS